MIQLTAQMRILVAVEPVDFRRGIDGLGRLCRQALATDPFSGAVFVFRSRSGTAVKILCPCGERAGRRRRSREAARGVHHGHAAIARAPTSRADAACGASGRAAVRRCPPCRVRYAARGVDGSGIAGACGA